MKIVKNFDQDKLTILSGWISKLLNIIFTFINIRLIFDLIELKGFGIHSFLLSFLPWISLLNMGFPQVIQNKISGLIALNENHLGILEKANKTVGYLLLIVILSSSIIAFFLLKSSILSDFNYILLFLVLFIMGVCGVNEIYTKILYSIRKGYIANIIIIINFIFVFILLKVLYNLNINDISTVITTYLSPYLLSFVLSFIFANKYFKNENNTTLKCSLELKKSLSFLLLGILSNIVLRIDYFVLGYCLTPEEIAIYALITKYFSTVSIFYSSILLVLWPKFTQLLTTNNFTEINESLKYSILVGFLIITSATIVLILFKDKIFFLLTGEYLSISISICLFAAVYFMLRILTDTFSTLIQSSGKLKHFTYFVIIQAFLMLFTHLYFVGNFGLVGIYYSLIVNFLGTSCWVLPVIYIKTIKK